MKYSPASIRGTLLLLIFLVPGTLFSFAQIDSTLAEHSPRKATIYSTVLPGLGQAYNKKYWKIPIVYAGLGALGYSFVFNNDKYKTFRSAYIARLDGDPLTGDNYENIYTAENLKVLRDYYRRNRDLSVVGFAAVYVLNIIDAHVDAHLFYFDLSDDISFKLYQRPDQALSLCFKF